MGGIEECRTCVGETACRANNASVVTSSIEFLNHSGKRAVPLKRAHHFPNLKAFPRVRLDTRIKRAAKLDAARITKARNRLDFPLPSYGDLTMSLPEQFDPVFIAHNAVVSTGEYSLIRKTQVLDEMRRPVEA